jgi:hypothetical protein
MHSSPSLALLLGRAPAAAFIMMSALASSSCQDSSEPAGQTPGASVPAERDAATVDASTQSPSSMTRVGAPFTSTGASGAKAPAAADAGPPDPMRSEPSTPPAPDLSCSADSACKAVDSTCGSCRCLILPAGMEPPACTGPKVTCIVAPCLNKRAVCSGAMCALQDEGPNAM